MDYIFKSISSLVNSIKSENLINKSDANINKYLKAIDTENIREIKFLVDKEINVEKNRNTDIVFEIYNNNFLTIGRLLFIVKHCTKYLNISSNLVKKLIEKEEVDLLDIIFDAFSFFDNQFILCLLNHYKNKTSILLSDLIQQIEKYKILIKNNEFYYSIILDQHLIIANKSVKYLFSACENGNENMVKYLIEHGVNINGENCFGETPLFYSCRRGNEKMVKYLIGHGADINKKTKFHKKPLLFNACGSGIESFVRYLVEHGFDINEKDNNGETPLFDACYSGNEDIVKYLVELGADINIVNKQNKTLLFNACYSGNGNLVKYFIDNGIDIDIVDDNGETPLFNACRSGNKQLVEYLIKLGANINKENNKYETPLFKACESGNESLVKYLVELGADINKENNKGETPLFNVCKCEKFYESKVINEYKTPFNMRKNDNQSLVKYSWAWSRYK